MTLYELTEQARELLDMMENSDAPEQCVKDTFESVEGDFTDKVEAYIVIIKELENDIEKCKTERKRLEERIKSADRNIVRLKNIITAAAMSLNMKNVKTEHFTINRFNSEKLDIYDSVPDSFKKEVQTVRKDVDKEKIKETLNSGEKLDFARYVSSCTIK